MNEKIGYKDIFRQREYMKMIIAALINRFGDAIDAIAFTWIVYEITNNAAWSAVIFGINHIPSVLITPLAGAWVEGKNKKAVMVMTDIIRAVCVAVVATGYLCSFLKPWMLAVITFTISTAEAFRNPANTALTPKILDRKYYEYGMSLSGTLSTVSELVGSAVAAGIIALIGSAGAIYIDMVTFILSAAIIMTVRSKEEKPEKQKFNAKEYMETLLEGVSYVKKRKYVMFLCATAVFLNAMLVPFNSLQAPLTDEILKGGPEVLSILGIALTVGMLLGSLLYPMVSKIFKARTIVFLGGVIFGLYYLGLVVATPLYEVKWITYIYVALISVITGFGFTVLSSYMNVEFVKSVEEDYLARAASIMCSFSMAAIPVTALVVSVLAVFVKTEWIFIGTALINFVVIFLMAQNKEISEETMSENPVVLE